MDLSIFALARRAAAMSVVVATTMPIFAQTPAKPATPPSTPASQPATAPNQTAATLAEFTARINEYMAMHRKLANETGKINDTKKPAEITLREEALGKLIQTNRAEAKQGDLFTPAVQTLFKAIIKQEYARRTAAMRKDRKQDQDELADFTPIVNQTYPPQKPLVTFPAGLLRALPKLPRELEYRLVQRNLILRDIEANIIVDFIPAATP
ncbi:MAG: hypothetical protein K2Y23_06390 [Cyanobacteria bacterium]|nr:hypothetical protein [Cyanobacteriota bacterium]